MFLEQIRITSQLLIIILFDISIIFYILVIIDNF